MGTFSMGITMLTIEFDGPFNKKRFNLVLVPYFFTTQKKGNSVLIDFLSCHPQIWKHIYYRPKQW